MPESIRIELNQVVRVFASRPVFKPVSFAAGAGRVVAITGPNGCGKSTLMRIAAGILRSSSGSVVITERGLPMPVEARRAAIGYAAPDLMLYPELTGVENLRFFAELRGFTLTRDVLAGLLKRVGLLGRGKDCVSVYSSGMRHRLKIAFALSLNPPILMLDEPTANLDAAGGAMVRAVVTEHRASGPVLIATNETEELEWADEVVRIEPA